MAFLVAFLRDGVWDLPSTQVLPDEAGGVGAVGQDMAGAHTWPPEAGPWHPNPVHDLGEHGGVTALSGGDNDGKDVEGGVDGQMDFGGQPAAGASDRVVVRLGRQPFATRPALTGSPLLRAPAAC